MDIKKKKWFINFVSKSFSYKGNDCAIKKLTDLKKAHNLSKINFADLNESFYFFSLLYFMNCFVMVKSICE